MYVRLAFAVAAHLEPEILLVDEVLAVGDAEFQRKCLGKMQDVAGHGRTVLFVSHNAPAIGRICGTALSMNPGTLSSTDRAPSFSDDTREPRSAATAASPKAARVPFGSRGSRSSILTPANSSSRGRGTA